jgi:hypothetical protein
VKIGPPAGSLDRADFVLQRRRLLPAAVAQVERRAALKEIGMPRQLIMCLAGLFISLTASAVLAADARISLPGGGALILPVPDGWRQAQYPGPVATLSLTPASGNGFRMLVSPLARAGTAIASMDAPSVRKLVESGAAGARSQAVEKSLAIEDLRSSTVQGNYFSATDRAPKPGEFKYMTQGVMLVSGLPVTFTILSNDNAGAAVEPALLMLKAARREP